MQSSFAKTSLMSKVLPKISRSSCGCFFLLIFKQLNGHFKCKAALTTAKTSLMLKVLPKISQSSCDGFILFIIKHSINQSSLLFDSYTRVAPATAPDGQHPQSDVEVSDGKLPAGPDPLQP